MMKCSGGELTQVGAGASGVPAPLPRTADAGVEGQ